MSTNKCDRCLNKNYNRRDIPCLGCVDNPTLHPTTTAFLEAPTPSCATCRDSDPKGRPGSSNCYTCTRAPEDFLLKHRHDEYRLAICCGTCANDVKSARKAVSETCKLCLRKSGPNNNWTPRTVGD